jgi:hypothetical protein
VIIMIPLVAIVSLWALWHDVGVFRTVSQTRLGGPTYERASYDTQAECETAQVAAMASEALPRAGPLTEQLSDGIKVWDPDRQYYSTLRYACWPAGAGAAPFR